MLASVSSGMRKIHTQHTTNSKSLVMAVSASGSPDPSSLVHFSPMSRMFCSVTSWGVSAGSSSTSSSPFPSCCSPSSSPFSSSPDFPAESASRSSEEFSSAGGEPLSSVGSPSSSLPSGMGSGSGSGSGSGGFVRASRFSGSVRKNHNVQTKKRAASAFVALPAASMRNSSWSFSMGPTAEDRYIITADTASWKFCWICGSDGRTVALAATVSKTPASHMMLRQMSSSEGCEARKARPAQAATRMCPRRGFPLAVSGAHIWERLSSTTGRIFMEPKITLARSGLAEILARAPTKWYTTRLFSTLVSSEVSQEIKPQICSTTSWVMILWSLAAMTHTVDHSV